jgi:hypothetical protein
MSTAIDDPPRRRSSATPAQRLRTSMAAVRLSISWFGTRKTLSAEQKAQAADTFGAEGEFLSAGKKLIDTKHPAFKAVTAVKSKAVGYWKSLSLPYPEPGLRLIRQDAIDTFDVQVRTFREDLDEAVVALDRQYDTLKAAAAERLGSSCSFTACFVVRFSMRFSRHQRECFSTGT